MTTGHASTELIADYAAGTLAQGMSLLVASHLTFCPTCRDKAARLEALGGALLVGGDAIPPAPRCLRGALARLEAPAEATAPEERNASFPLPLCRRVGRKLSDLSFETLSRGLAAFPLEGFPGEAVVLMRAAPGVHLPVGGDSPRDAALVLEGHMHDGAHRFARGDLAVAPRAPEAAGERPCLCLVVQPES